MCAKSQTMRERSLLPAIEVVFYYLSLKCMGIGRVCGKEGEGRSRQGPERWADSLLRSLNFM